MTSGHLLEEYYCFPSLQQSHTPALLCYILTQKGILPEFCAPGLTLVLFPENASHLVLPHLLVPFYWVGMVAGLAVSCLTDNDLLYDECLWTGFKVWDCFRNEGNCSFATPSHLQTEVWSAHAKCLFFLFPYYMWIKGYPWHMEVH